MEGRCQEERGAIKLDTTPRKPLAEVHIIRLHQTPSNQRTHRAAIPTRDTSNKKAITLLYYTDPPIHLLHPALQTKLSTAGSRPPPTGSSPPAPARWAPTAERTAYIAAGSPPGSAARAWRRTASPAEARSSRACRRPAAPAAGRPWAPRGLRRSPDRGPAAAGTTGTETVPGRAARAAREGPGPRAAGCTGHPGSRGRRG